MGFVTDTAWRIQNAAFAKDPFTDYVPLARQLVEQQWSLDVWKRITGWIAPGYPGILSAGIALFGDFAPMWINLGFAYAWIVLLGFWVWRRTGSLPMTAGAVFGWWFFLGFGHVNNAHFALYAYRHLPVMCFILLAWICCDARRPWVQWLATFVILLGCLVRETALLAFPGCLLLVLRDGFARELLPETGRRALRCLGPLLPVALVGLLLLSVNEQIQHIWELITTGRNFNRGIVGVQAFGQIGWIGWIGVALAVLAAVRHQKGRLLVLCMASAAIGFTLIYSFTPWSPRYPFCVTFWLGPVAGVGLGYLFTLIPRVREWETAFVLAVLLLGLGLQFTFRKTAAPFFPVVTAADVKGFVTQMKDAVPPDEVLILDRQSSLASAVVGSYLPHGLMNGVEHEPRLTAGERHHYLLPVNQAALAGKKVKTGAADWELVRQSCDMDPTEAVQLGAANFQLFAVQSFSETNVVATVEAKNTGGWAMLDFRQATFVAPPTLSVRSHTAFTAPKLSRQPVQFIALPRFEQDLELACASGFPIPKDWLWTTFPASQAIKINMDKRRPISTLRWFKSGWWKKGPRETYGVALLPDHQARLEVPVPGLNGSGRLACSLVFLPAAPDAAGQISWRPDSAADWVESGFSAQRNVAVRLEQDYADGQASCAFELLLRAAEDSAVELRLATVFLEYGTR